MLFIICGQEMERVWACVFVELNESIPKQKLQFSVHQIDWVGK